MRYIFVTIDIGGIDCQKNTPLNSYLGEISML
jgi:hypothetical protein